MIKWLFYTSLISIVLFACRVKNNHDPISDFTKNNFNLDQGKKFYFDNIHFKSSKYFEQLYYNHNITLHDKSFKRYIPDMHIYLTVEKFDEEELGWLEEIYFEGDDLKNASTYFIEKKTYANTNSKFSVIDKLPFKSKYKGLFISNLDELNNNKDQNINFNAFVKIDKDLYLFQFITKLDNAKYLKDDFIQILKSINK
jgi:hypothetical protein